MNRKAIGRAAPRIDLMNGRLIAVEAARGLLRSDNPLKYPTAVEPADGPFAPIAVTEGFVWSVDRLKRLLAIARADARVTVCATPQGNVAAPLVIGDGRLFVVDMDGRLSVFAQERA